VAERYRKKVFSYCASMNRQNYYFSGILPKHDRVALRGTKTA